MNGRRTSDLASSPAGPPVILQHHCRPPLPQERYSAGKEVKCVQEEAGLSLRVHARCCVLSNVLHLSLHPFMKVWITRAALLRVRSLVCSRIISRESLRNNKITQKKHPFVQHIAGDSLNANAVFFVFIFLHLQENLGLAYFPLVFVLNHRAADGFTAGSSCFLERR